MEQHSTILCECEFFTMFLWTLPKACRSMKSPSHKCCFKIVLTENKFPTHLYTPQTKWLGASKFCFLSVKMFYLNLSCVFYHSMESFNTITHRGKKMFLK